MKYQFDKQRDSGFLSFERSFFSIVNLIAACISFLGFIINCILDLNKVLLIITTGTTLFYFAIFFLIKLKKYDSFYKWITSLVTILILNLLWFYNYGFRGPAPYFFVVIYSILIYIWHGNQLRVFTVIIIINLFILFILDFYYPNLTRPYINQQSQIVDVYTGLLFYIGLIFLVISEAKNSYIREYSKAKEAEHLKSAFLANMSHEIRTPLNAIVGFSHLLTETEINQSKRIEFKDLIEENTNQLLQLINDILDISKIESNQFTVTQKPVILSKVIDSVSKNAKLLTENKQNENINFIIEIEEPNFEFISDEVRINQILNNLISNAFKFTDNGSIKLRVYTQENEINFELTDTGIGIDEELQKKIFDRFFRIGNTGIVNAQKELYRGTGLGLYLSQNIAKKLGGNLTVKSKLNIGSTFCFKLPVKEIRILPEVKVEPIVIQSKTKLEIKDLKVMVVEDDFFNQIFFRELFKRFGIQIRLANSGENAVEILASGANFHLIFLDIKLPGINGFEVLKYIKEKDIKAKVIAQTANGMEGDEQNCLEAGFDQYLSKPIKKAMIEGLLHEFIENS